MQDLVPGLDPIRPRIYIDTSVVGAYYGHEFRSITRLFFRRLEEGELIFVLSDLLEEELESAPDEVREHLNRYPEDCFERVRLNNESIQLANRYMAEKVVGETSLRDCRHIALATVAKVDVLASWNFRHMVNWDRIQGYNLVNIQAGYPPIEIRNPRDLLNHTHDD